MDAELWFKDWAIQYDGFPDDYLVIDVETTGSCIDKDLIVQLGWCKVINRRVIDNTGIVLDWTNSPYVNTRWLRSRMIETAKQIHDKSGAIYPWTYQSLTFGVNPIIGLANFLEQLAEVRNTEQLLIAHNGVGFDFPLLSRHFNRFLKINYAFRPDEIWDTGALEKAVQLDEILCDGELPGDFAYRLVTRTGDGVKWNLHEHVIPKYDLANRFSLDLTKSHTAPFDAYVTHLLFEDFRALAQ